MSNLNSQNHRLFKYPVILELLLCVFNVYFICLLLSSSQTSLKRVVIKFKYLINGLCEALVTGLKILNRSQSHFCCQTPLRLCGRSTQRLLLRTDRWRPNLLTKPLWGNPQSNYFFLCVDYHLLN